MAKQGRFKGENDPLFGGRIYAVYEGTGSLPDLCRGLLAEGLHSWPLLKEGYSSLEQVQERLLLCNGFSVHIQYNPRRIKSTAAKLEEDDPRGPCFLCLPRLPVGQRGILYRDEFFILCNPQPVFPGHYTVSHVDHRPQSLLPHFGMFLELMSDLEAEGTVLYNGPKCGASCPYHLHFQVIPKGFLPIERELDEARGEVLLRERGTLLSLLTGLGREVILLEGEDPQALTGAVGGFMEGLKGIAPCDDEPLVNVAGFFTGEKWRLLLFPRRKHRPAAFFQEGEERLVVSPGVIDMAGVIITPLERDFLRLTEELVVSLYREVSLNALSCPICRADANG